VTISVTVLFLPRWLVREARNEDRPGRDVVDDDDLLVGTDLAAVGVTRQECLHATADGHHHLAEAPRADRARRGHAPDTSDGRGIR
jgi:hypothetical protein